MVAPDATLKLMDHELEALRKTREHIADVSELARLAEEDLREGRFGDASACLRLIEQHAASGREALLAAEERLGGPVERRE